MVAKAAPDGYTIGASITGPLVNNTVLYKRMPYDPFRDLAPITFGVHQANVLAVSPSLGVNTLKELMDLLRRNPGKYNYASIGVGSLTSPSRCSRRPTASPPPLPTFTLIPLSLLPLHLVVTACPAGRPQ